MSKINRKITADKFEIIRDQIYFILKDEIANQFQLSYDSEIDAKISIENTNPEDIIVDPTVNISVAKGNYDSKDQRSVKGTYQYFIDCYTSAKTTPSDPGNYLAAKRLHKLMRICRSILNDPIYKTLGFKTPFIYRTYFQDFNIRNMPGKTDTVNSKMGRLLFIVEASEENTLITPELIEGFQTKVNINSSGDGYFWEDYNY